LIAVGNRSYGEVGFSGLGDEGDTRSIAVSIDWAAITMRS
jgi:hypothetical protein